MSKKKIAGLVIAAVVAIGVVGGSLAWFTSTDSVVNKFATGGTDPQDPNSGTGVRAYEKFDKEKAGKALPGVEVDKEVQAKNTATYDQFIRVKLTPHFTATPNIGTATADDNLIVLDFASNLGTDTSTQGKWVKEGDYYYYVGKVAAGSFTNELLHGVTLSDKAGSEYKGAAYDVKVDVESVQADGHAIKDQWKDATNAKLTDLLLNLDNSATGQALTGTQITGAVAGGPAQP